MLKSVSSITNAIGALNFKGTWNASTNTPTLASGVGTKGDYFVVSVAGSTTLDGISNWGVGDWATYNGTTWQRVEGGADLNGVNISFTGTASGPTYETSNLASGLTMADNEIDADGTDTNIDVIINPKGTGGLGVGGNTTGVVGGATITSKFCVKHEGSNQTGGFVHVNNTTAASGAGIFACRSRGTLAAPTIVQDNDNLATISFAGSDGVDLALAARISVEVDGTPGSNDMPGRMVFLTTPDGSQTPVEAMKIDSAQNVTVTAGNLVIGTSGKGIDFSATPGTGTSELLADYEEGTWTPTLTSAGGDFTTIAYGDQQGFYTKVGRQVTVYGFLFTSGAITAGSASGQVFISGLPFAVVQAGIGDVWTSPDTANYNSPLALATGVTAGGSTLRLFKNGLTNNPAFAVTDLNVAGGPSNYIFFQSTYFV
jgi:hypothetical protein